MGPKYSYDPKFFLEILLCPWTAAWACTKTVGICALTFAGLLFLSPCPVGLIKRLRRRSGSAFGRPTMRLCPGSRWPPSPRPRACPSPRSKASWRLWSGTGVRNLASHLGDPVSCPKRMFWAFLTNHYGLFFALRWRKRLVILAKRHPFMGAHRLSQEIYESMMATYASMPPGHQFQVCLTCTNNLATNITSQIPPKPCARWVQKILVKEGFRSLRSKKKPLLNKVNRAKRLLFARKYSNFDWSRTIFSDEKIFRVRPGARVRCWVAPNDSRFSPKYLTSSVQKPEGGHGLGSHEVGRGYLPPKMPTQD